MKVLKFVDFLEPLWRENAAKNKPRNIIQMDKYMKAMLEAIDAIASQGFRLCGSIIDPDNLEDGSFLYFQPDNSAWTYKCSQAEDLFLAFAECRRNNTFYNENQVIEAYQKFEKSFGDEIHASIFINTLDYRPFYFIGKRVDKKHEEIATDTRKIETEELGTTERIGKKTSKPAK